MKIRLPNLYSQQDTRWGNLMLGFNTSYPYNIFNYGCLLVSQSMICTYYGYTITPDKLNTSLKSEDGFVSGGLYVWGTLPTIYPIKEIKKDTPSKLTDIQIKEIKTAIDEGHPVMLQIDYKPATSALDMHYVVAIDFSSTDFTVADPIDGTIKQLSTYSSNFKKLIWQYVIYKAEVPESVPVEELETCEVKLARMTKLKDDWKDKAKNNEKIIEEKDTQYTTLKTLCEQIESQRNDLVIEIEKTAKINKELENKIYIINSELKNALETILGLNKAIENLKSERSEYNLIEILDLVTNYIKKKI